MHDHHPPPGDEPPSQHPQPGDTPQHDEHEHGHNDHQHGEVCCRDTILTINGHSIDLAREPLKLEFCGFTLAVSYSAAKERTPGEKHVEQYKGYEIAIVGPDKGDRMKGRPPGRLFINGKHIEYIYHPATGEIGHRDMFSLHRSLLDLARTYIVSNPTLTEFPTHQH